MHTKERVSIMAKKYRLQRHYDRINPKVESSSVEKDSQAPWKKTRKLSIWTTIRSFFSVLVAIIIALISIVIATPFIIINVLLNWIKLAIGFSFLWIIGLALYNTLFRKEQLMNADPFTNTVIWWILILSFIAAIFVTIAEFKE